MHSLFCLTNFFVYLKTYGSQFSNDVDQNCNVKHLHWDNEQRLKKRVWQQQTVQYHFFLNSFLDALASLVLMIETHKLTERLEID